MVHEGFREGKWLVVLGVSGSLHVNNCWSQGRDGKVQFNYLPYCAESLPNGWGYLCFMSVFYEALAE